MPETIVCPQCKRRLVLPDGVRPVEAQCPSCKARFSTEPGWANQNDARDTPRLSSHGEPLLPATGPRRPREEGPLRPGKSRSDLDAVDRGVKRPSRAWVTWVVLAGFVGLVVVLVGLGTVLSALNSRNFWSTSRPTVAPEDMEQRRLELRAAFKDVNPLAAKEMAQELKPLFEGLGRAFAAANGEQIVGHFDLDRMTEEFAAVTTLPLQSSRQKRDFTVGLRQGISQTLAEQAPFLSWTGFQIRNVKKRTDNEAVVIVRHDTANEATLKMRWWVIRQGGIWKVYDLEDLDTGLRTSTTMALLVAGGLEKAPEVSRAVQVIREAMRDLVMQDNVDGADRKMKSIAAVRLPRPIEALRSMVQGIVYLRRGDSKEAVESLERARTLHPDMPMLDFLEGIAFNQLGQWAKALKHLEAYRDLLGEDALICQQLGDSLCELNRFADAAVEYRKALDFNPKATDSYLGLLRSLSNDEKGEVGPRFAQLGQWKENFDVMAKDCNDRKVDDILEHLCQAMEKIDPKYPPVDFYLSLCKARARQGDHAATLFKGALRLEGNKEKQKGYIDDFLVAMASGGAYVDAYNAVPVQRDAFRILAPKAFESYRHDELKKLVVLHTKKDASDPLLPFYQAAVYTREDRYALADKTFTLALAKAPKELDITPFRQSRVLARYYTGQGLSAYREIKPRKETFLQLANLAFQQNHDTRLIELLDAHARNEPDDVDIPRFRMRLKVRQRQIPEGIALFKKMLARRLLDKKRQEIVSEFLFGMIGAGAPIEAYKSAPVADHAFGVVAEELVEEGDVANLRRLLEVHRKARPADPWLAYYQAEIHLHELAWAKAAGTFREGLKQAPKEARERFRSRLVYAEYKSGRGLQAYAESDAPDKNFTQLAYLFANDKKGADLEALLKAHRPRAGKDADLLGFEIRAKVFLKKPDEAIALLQKAIKAQPQSPSRNANAYWFLTEMESRGQTLEAYRAVPDKVHAFETLAPRLLSLKKDKELAALIAEHAKSHANDPLTLFYQGELALLRGDLPRAEQHFATAFAKGQAKDQWRLRNGLFRVRVKAGKAVATYEEVTPGSATFEALAYLCQENKDVKQLQGLIAAHRKRHPDDASLTQWDLEAKWLNHDDEGILALIAKHREGDLILPQARAKAENYLVRTLIRQKKFTDAIREAEAARARYSGDTLLLLYAHAAAGDVKQTITVLESLRPQPYYLRRCYQDADLGPLWRSEAFRELREKFPEPKENAGRRDRDWDD